MTAFIGADALEDSLTDRICGELSSAAAGSLGPSEGEVRCTANAFFIHSHSTALFATARPDSAFVAEARLDNRSELAASLGLSAADLAGMPDAALLFRVFERRGPGGIADCVGAFAFAHWDGRARRLTLARDCLGQASLLFHRARGTIFFSNRLGALLAVPSVPRQVDDIAIVNLLVANWNDRCRTAYREVERTPSRTLVTIDRGGMQHRHYWSPDLGAPPPYQRDEDYVARARELFDQAVLTATAGRTEIAIAASGGLDSSAIAATVARQGRMSRIRCYTTLPPADADIPVAARHYRDERDKVETLGRMYPELELNWLTQEGLQAIEIDESLYFAQARVPRRSGLALGGLAMMLEALRGQSLVLFGSMGNLCLTWAGPYALLALLRAHDWAGFAREFAATARIRHASRAQVLKSEVIWRGAPAGLRALWRRLHGQASPRFVDYAAVNPDFIAHSGVAQMWREQAFDPSGEVDGWNPARLRAWHMFDKVGADRDNLNWTEDAYGLATRDPFADRRLIEFALSVPERLYSRNGVPRAFARAVFADRLPREIVQETRRGVNRLAWFRTLDRRRHSIAAQVEHMAASATARRLIDIPRLKRLLDEWPKDERSAQAREIDYASVLPRAVHIGAFICWVESRGV